MRNKLCVLDGRVVTVDNTNHHELLEQDMAEILKWGH